VAFRHGSNAAISVSANLLTAYCDNVSLQRTRDTAETTPFGVSDKTHIQGLLSGSLSVSGNYDPTITVGPAAVLEGALTGAAAVACIYYPGGNTTGQRSHTFSGIVTEYNETSVTSDKVTFSATILVTGAVTTATI
jgi:hypothetical protein